MAASFIYFLCFWPCHAAYEILSPSPEIEPGPFQQWEHRVPATGLPGNSLVYIILNAQFDSSFVESIYSKSRGLKVKFDIKFIKQLKFTAQLVILLLSKNGITSFSFEIYLVAYMQYCILVKKPVVKIHHAFECWAWLFLQYSFWIYYIM